MKNLLLFVLFTLSTAHVFGQSVTPVGAPFQNGADMVFDFSGSTDSKDWIGIYNAGDLPDPNNGGVASINWGYVNGSGQTGSSTIVAAGTLTFPGNLPNGDYDVHLFCCDGYNVLASATFTVVGAAPASIAATTYPVVGQPVTFEYTGSTGDHLDWIGIYNAGAIPGTDGSLLYQYVPGMEGSVVFDDPAVLVPGNYDVHLFCCDGYTKYASTSFTVYEALAPSLAPVGTLSSNWYNTFHFTGGSGSFYDWVGIYHAGDMPDPGAGGVPSMAYKYVDGANGDIWFDPMPDSLIPGNFYDAHFFKDDGYEILASYLNWTVLFTDAGEVVVQPSIFTAFPNPAHGAVQLLFSERVSGRLNIFNAAGQVARRINLDGETQAEVSDLMPGMYMAQYQGNKGSQTVKLVIE
jgi:hypothetical protein